MKFFMYSCSGEGAQILKRIELEGNEVGLYIKDPIYQNVFDGLIRKVKSPDDFIDKKTIIIFDMSGNGDVADKWLKSGHKVFGASSFHDKLEHDRDFGFEAMESCGIKIPEMQKFKKFADGIKYAQENPEKRLVFKPNGSMPCKLTYVSCDSPELIAYMKFVEAQYGSKIDDFILQEFVEGSVVSSELFFDGEKLVYPYNHTIEVKKAMNDDLGPSTGCSGNTTWPCEIDRIIRDGIYKAIDLCKKNNFIGQLDLNTVINDSGVYGLEWTPRIGYSATPTLLNLLNIDFGQFFSDFLEGNLEEIDLENTQGHSVRLSISPYPTEPVEGVDTEEIAPSMGVPILDWERYQESLYFYEVMLQDDQLVHSGGTGVIAEIQGTGDDSAYNDIYEVAEEVHIPDKQYRTDLGKVIPKLVKEVKEYASR